MIDVKSNIPLDLPPLYIIEVVVSADDINGYGHVNNVVFAT
jgi:acyl-CoA thioesterase FadM